MKFMKWKKRIWIAVLFLPVVLAGAWGLYEIFGICANHIATQKQSDRLRTNLEREISDIEIVSIESQTGNASGTGNHVDCVSAVLFSTEMQEAEIEDCMSKYYVFDGWDCYIRETEDGYYMISVSTSAPFADNIEGH